MIERIFFSSFGALMACILVLTGLLVGGLMLVYWPYASHSCETKADAMGLEGEWTFWTDCRVLVGDQWLDIDSYRVTVEGDQ